MIVLGIGNRYRRDDGAAFALLGRLPGMMCVTEGTQLMEKWKGADFVVLVDAARSGSAPGTIHRFDASATPLPAASFHGSTHAFGLGDAIEMSRALGELPPRVVVFGIEGKEFGAGVELSPEVEGALDELARRVREEGRA